LARIQGTFGERRGKNNGQVRIHRGLAPDVLLYDYVGSEAAGAEVDVEAFYVGESTVTYSLGDGQFKQEVYGAKSRAQELLRYLYLHGPKPNWLDDM
jgi:hypothetical protein